MQTVWCKAEKKLHDIESFLKEQLENTEASDLSALEMHILEALYAPNTPNKRIKAGTLALEVGRVPTSFTPILDKLANKGYVERCNHPHDRRAIEVGLTIKGQAFVGDVRKALEAAEKKFK